MKLKYKLILLFIFITLMTLLPVSYIQTQRQENEKMSSLKHQGEIISRFLAFTVMNIILANGADIQISRIDAGDIFASLNNLTGDGLVLAEAVMLSSREKYNGVVLAVYDAERQPPPIEDQPGMPPESIARLKESFSFREITLPDRPGSFYEFTAFGALPGKPPICVCRILYAKSYVLAPISEMRRITIVIVICAVLIVALLGYVSSRMVSKPIVLLTEAAAKIQKGDLTLRVPVKSHDETGLLSSTFNHMLDLIRLKISELEHSNKKLIELDALKDEFLANISHELKTPLYGIVGIAESLLRGASGPLNQDAMNNIRVVIASGKTLGSLVNDILDFSKMKHFDLLLDRKRVDMFDIAQFVLSITRPLVGTRTLLLENKIEPEYALVKGDVSRLQQIMMNLVSNAVKFTEQGFVRISASRPAAEHQIIITVSDSGIGVQPEKYSQVFEPFQQGDGSITRNYGGSGLGLAITKKLVELHGGRIWFESVPGEGSSFSFSMPEFFETLPEPETDVEIERRKAAREAECEKPGVCEEGPDVPALINAGKARARILVVDDEPVNLLIVINHLVMEGYEVVTAGNGEQVDEFFSRGEIPDLILLDVMLPRISGFDICRKIRENYSSYELPIVMLTVRQSTRDIVAGISAGANDYLIKPVSGEELIARVGNLISMKKSVRMQSELMIIRNEMSMAIDLQKSILPLTEPVASGLVFASRFVPSSHVSGDFYDYNVNKDNSVGVIIADVAGHGVPAAMIAAMVQMAYASTKKKYSDPAHILKETNEMLGSYPDDVYLTACCVQIDTAAKRMRYSNAGHPPVLLYRRAEKKLLSFSVPGRPIGMFEDAVFETNETDLVPGDRIILYTDGIYEARNPDKQIFGAARFYSLIADGIGGSTGDFADSVVEAVKSWSMVASGKELSDDVTLVVIDFLPE